MNTTVTFEIKDGQWILKNFYQAAEAFDEAYVELFDETPPRKPGRPKGSKNKTRRRRRK